MLWRVLSQGGFGSGINSSPEGGGGLSILGTQLDSENPEKWKEAFRCCCNACRDAYTSLFLAFDARNDVAPGHECCDAVFLMFILDYNKTQETGQKHWIFMARANLNSFASCEEPGIGEFYSTTISEDIISAASLGKKSAQCCELEILYTPAPWPNNISGSTTEYIDTAQINWDGKNYGPWKGASQIAKRQNQRVHGDVTEVRIANDKGETLLIERFNAWTSKIVNVCGCPEGYYRNDPNDPDEECKPI